VFAVESPLFGLVSPAKRHGRTVTWTATFWRRRLKLPGADVPHVLDDVLPDLIESGACAVGIFL
jgi:hypothetical protein